jgi:hypothetical protein
MFGVGISSDPWKLTSLHPCAEKHHVVVQSDCLGACRKSFGRSGGLSGRSDAIAIHSTGSLQTT